MQHQFEVMLHQRWLQLQKFLWHQHCDVCTGELDVSSLANFLHVREEDPVAVPTQRKPEHTGGLPMLWHLRAAACPSGPRWPMRLVHSKFTAHRVSVRCLHLLTKLAVGEGSWKCVREGLLVCKDCHRLLTVSDLARSQCSWPRCNMFLAGTVRPLLHSKLQAPVSDVPQIPHSCMCTPNTIHGKRTGSHHAQPSVLAAWSGEVVLLMPKMVRPTSEQPLPCQRFSHLKFLENWG